MDQQAVYMPGYSAGAAQPFRGGPSLATPPGPQAFPDVNNKMSNLSLMNRPAAPGTSYPGPNQSYTRPPGPGYPVGDQGRVSPSMRTISGVSSGSLAPPAPLRTPNSASTPSSESVTDPV